MDTKLAVHVHADECVCVYTEVYTSSPPMWWLVLAESWWE